MTARPYVTVAAGTASGGVDPGYLGGSGARKLVSDEREAGRWLESNYSTTPREGAVAPPGSKLPRGRRSIHEPASTMTSKFPRWVFERPATTVAGDSRIWPPGHKVNAADEKRLGKEEAHGRYGDRAGTKAIRVTAAEAAALQSYPENFEFGGKIGAVAQQIGNAVPPLLAEAILREVLS
jgi:DNA (cytosine-5)-methyltransferase 1